MSKCRDIVRRALRLIGELTSGQEPTGPDAEDGVERLQGLILDLPGLIQNGQWHERAIAYPTPYAAREGHRYTVTAPGSVVLPATITWDACHRPPHDLTKVQILGAADNAGLWIYSATNGAWRQADALTINSDSPFGQEDDEGLAAQLAVNMADEYGETVALGPRTLSKAQQSTRSFRARFKKHELRDHRRYDGHRAGFADYW
jgi:hypothetical protein